MALSKPWVPTVNDLRVKLCYICREEERYDDPQKKLTAWVHPCSCTLIAHESCLLNWIQSSQEDSGRAKNALKCPQCGTHYELESDNPFILRLLNHLHTSLSVAGKVVTVCGVTGVVVACGFGLYIMLTTYGSYALQEFLGKEMYNQLLTDDPSNWPWHAFINLPLIPISLIAARSRIFETIPIFPLFLTWTSSPPVGPTLTTTPYPLQPLIRWPPSPLMASIMLPLITSGYRSLMGSLRHWVLGTPPAELPPVRRIIWAINEGGPAQLRVRIAANLREEPPQQPERRPRRGRGQPRQGGRQQQRQQERNEEEPREGEEGDEQPDNPAAAAERTIRITGGSLGRFVGGALLIPAIANRMGTLLYNLSKHFSLLRKFLGIRPSYGVGLGRYAILPTSAEGKTWSQLTHHLRVVLNIFFGGTKVWTESDPVWWRNTVGLGIFVLAKDCLSLLHVYLTKREIETRHVKSRSFEGVDVKELDLIDPPPAASR